MTMKTRMGLSALVGFVIIGTVSAHAGSGAGSGPSGGVSGGPSSGTSVSSRRTPDAGQTPRTHSRPSPNPTSSGPTPG
ncbi:hypothetical protein ABZ619_23125 [Streptomyces sp. NPDC007851]|uniref:hypothetical protein n=1 Tax=Streptomyces sp. NPDC007851 TaxID=3155008 RepID=UPI003411C977